MTSLDFQSLLKHEKALRRAKLVEEKNAAQLKDLSFKEKARTSLNSNPDDVDEPSNAAALLTNDNSSAAEERMDPWKRGELSLCFTGLADGPRLQMDTMRVGSTPTIFYVPDFVSDVDAQTILAKTYSHAGTAERSPSSQEGDINSSSGDTEWVALRSRRLKCWGGQPGEAFRPEPLPPWLEALCDALVKRGVFTPTGKPDHILLNEYHPGQGIMPHTDGPFYEPRTATLSLGSDAIMHFSPRVATADIGQPGVDIARTQASLVLRDRCLVVFADDAYSHLLHGLDAVREETVGTQSGVPIINGDAAGAPEGTLIRRRLRVSLTFRKVCAGTLKSYG